MLVRKKVTQDFYREIKQKHYHIVTIHLIIKYELDTLGRKNIYNRKQNLQNIFKCINTKRDNRMYIAHIH